MEEELARKGRKERGGADEEGAEEKCWRNWLRRRKWPGRWERDGVEKEEGTEEDKWRKWQERCGQEIKERGDG